MGRLSSTQALIGLSAIPGAEAVRQRNTVMEMSGRRETGTVRACLCRAVYRLEGFLFYKIHFLTLPCLRIQPEEGFCGFVGEAFGSVCFLCLKSPKHKRLRLIAHA